MTLKDFLKWIYPAVNFISHIFSPSKASTFPRFQPKVISLRRIRLAFTLLVFLLSLSATFGYYFILKDLPSPTNLTSKPIPLTTHIKDRHGNELYKIYSRQNRTLIPLKDLPDYVKHATISIEDQDFYHHSGFSVPGTFRAVWRTLTNVRLEGGSTITQQLVKTSLLSPERSLRRKIRELFLSLAVETIYTKDQILEMYLNRVSFGGSAYGIEEAAQTYFGTSAAKLTLAQAALLAGLPASPTTYSPHGIHPELAKSRQKEVLRRMVAEGYVTWDQAESASNEELSFQPPDIDIKAPHFVMYVKELLAQKYGTDLVEQGGLEVITSLDLDIQNAAQSVVTQEINSLSYLNVTNGAALATNPKTGEILAMVGSKDYFDIKNDGNVNVTLALRQPGSSIKPINYALALSRGFTPASIIDDSPITYRIPGQPDYKPVNYDNRYHGKVTLRQALANSYNIPAVKVLSSNGIENFVDLAINMGISSWTDSTRFGLSLTLGAGEVTMMDMATAYGVFANHGSRVSPQPILSVRTSSGETLEEFTASKSTSVLDPRIAFLISDILSDNIARTPTFGSRSDLYIPDQQVAVKTGTTNQLRDNWTIGYTSDLLVAVWVGNNDNSPMSYIASGVTGASPIWKKIITPLLATRPQNTFTPPEGVVKVAVCPSTGQLACASCPGRPEYFLSGTQPKIACVDLPIAVSPTPPAFDFRILTGDSSLPIPTIRTRKSRP